MEILNYNELPETIKGVLKSKIESELIHSHKEMGLSNPKKWQVENRLDCESKNYLFYHDNGNYYFFKLEEISYFNK